MRRKDHAVRAMSSLNQSGILICSTRFIGVAPIRLRTRSNLDQFCADSVELGVEVRTELRVAFH